MYVRVDATGDHVFSARIDHARGLDLERLRRHERHDPAVMDADIDLLGRVRRNHQATLDQRV